MSQIVICRALVCRIANYRDQDAMLTLLSPEQGQISAIARGCKKATSRLAAGSQLFAFGEYDFRERNGRFSLVQCDLYECFFDLAQNYQAFAAGQFVLQSCVDIAPVGQPCEDVFSLAYYTLSHLCYGNEEVSDVLIYFLLNFLQLQGVRPATITCAICEQSTFEQAIFHERYGAICGHCAKQYTGNPVQALTLEAMFRMLRLPLDELHKLKLPPTVRQEALSVLPSYFVYHIEKNHAALQAFLRSLQ